MVFRFVWMILVLCGAISIIYFSIILHSRFTSNLMATVVESTNYPTYEISFPAITVCNFNRVNSMRVVPAIEK